MLTDFQVGRLLHILSTKNWMLYLHSTTTKCFISQNFIKLINEYYQTPLEKQNICHWKQCSFH